MIFYHAALILLTSATYAQDCPPYFDSLAPALQTQNSIQTALQQHKQTFDRLFATSGFSNFKEYERVLEAAKASLKGAPKAEVGRLDTTTYLRRERELLQTLEDLESNQVEIRIHFRPKKLSEILNKGYLNSVEGGKGSIQAGDLSALNQIEASMLGLPPDQIKNIPPASRAHYGMLGPPPTHEGKTPPGYYDRFNTLQDAFGDYVLILDPRDYKNNLTITAGDSANTLQRRLKASTPTEMKWVEPRHWDDLFIPWERRSILFPYFNNDYEKYQPQYQYFLETSAFHGLNNWKLYNAPEGVGPDAEYFEVQVWQAINKIKAIEVPANAELPPEAIQLLKSRGIPIRRTNWVNWPPPPELQK